jgi:hypothetical protein
MSKKYNYVDVEEYLLNKYIDAIQQHTFNKKLENSIRGVLREFVNSVAINQMFYRHAYMLLRQLAENEILASIVSELEVLLQGNQLQDFIEPIAKTMLDDAKRKVVVAPCEACEKYAHIANLEILSCKKPTSTVNKTVKLVETFV